MAAFKRTQTDSILNTDTPVMYRCYPTLYNIYNTTASASKSIRVNFLGKVPAASVFSFRGIVTTNYLNLFQEENISSQSHWVIS